MMRAFHPLPIIDDVVAGRYQAPELGGPLKTDISRVAVADSLDGAERDLVAGLDLGTRLAVVGDENTWPVLGARVAAALGDVDVVVLDHPKADEATADALQERARHADALVAVGSGTINDLCKHVTHRTGRRCAVFATGLSMDGYVTTTVSITRDGFKLSLPAHAPVGVFFDLGVLAAAPSRMARAGLGDTVCRTTAQLDWLLSHILLDTVYAETPYRLMAEDEPKLYAQAHLLPKGDLGATLLLTRMLILSGLGVLVTHTSHCGSMGEHSISHFVDTFADPHPKTLHGEQVGIASWSMARLQAAMLEREEAPVLAPLPLDEATFARRYGRLAPSCLAAARKKPFDPAGTEGLNRRLAERWPEIRRRVGAAMLPPAEMERVMRAAGAALHAAELGIDPAFYRRAVGHAHEIRDRYGFLDLAAQAGRLERFAAGEG
jgi:glycerol-1-phosphate dehydrogenase [NAD(P)+]